MLDHKFTMSDRTRDINLLVLITFGDSFNFMSSSVAKYLAWAIKLKRALVTVKLANGSVFYSSGIANGFVLSGVYQAYVIF